MAKGNIECENKEDAIMVIIGLMEAFDIKSEELNY